MEIKQIYDCQEILKIVQEAVTKEELECKKLFLNKSTVEWLSERKSDLDKEIKVIEGKILEKDVILSKKKDKEKINKELESKTNELNSIDISEKILQSLVY